jgi:hypothetical protein
VRKGVSHINFSVFMALKGFHQPQWWQHKCFWAKLCLPQVQSSLSPLSLQPPIIVCSSWACATAALCITTRTTLTAYLWERIPREQNTMHVICKGTGRWKSCSLSQPQPIGWWKAHKNLLLLGLLLHKPIHFQGVNVSDDNNCFCALKQKKKWGKGTSYEKMIKACLKKGNVYPTACDRRGKHLYFLHHGKT